MNAYYPKCQKILQQIRLDRGVLPSKPSVDSLILEELLLALSKTDISDLHHFGQRLTPFQIDLLVNANATLTSEDLLLKCSILFYHVRKTKYEESTRLFLNRARSELVLGRAYSWIQNNLDAWKSQQGWVHRWGLKTEFEAPCHFLYRGLIEGRETWKDFIFKSTQCEPLFLDVLDRLFVGEARNALEIMPFEIAQLIGRMLLTNRNVRRLVQFFSMLPEDTWAPDLVAETIKVFGPPDPKIGSFYRSLPEGVLWSLRVKVFFPLVQASSLQGFRVDLWKNWIHHCTDCVLEDAFPIVKFGKLKLKESLEATTLEYEGSSDEIRVIPFDPGWHNQITGILNEHLYG